MRSGETAARLITLIPEEKKAYELEVLSAARQAIAVVHVCAVRQRRRRRS